MSKQDKIARMFDRYRKLFKERINATPMRYRTTVRKGYRIKNRVLHFYLMNARWPSRTSEKISERKLGLVFENACSKESPGFDRNLRRIALALGRKVNAKRKHDPQNRKTELIEFIMENGRAPSDKTGNQAERKLAQKLYYYTTVGNDMVLLSKVYELDPCHKTGIPKKYRTLINANISNEIPLIKMPLYKLNGESK